MKAYHSATWSPFKSALCMYSLFPLMHAERYLGGLQRGIWVLQWPNLLYLLHTFLSVICISTVYLSCFNILPPVCISTNYPMYQIFFNLRARLETWFIVQLSIIPSIDFCFDFWYLQHELFFYLSQYPSRNYVTIFVHYNLEVIVIVI